MQSMLQANPDIIGVISGNDEMALGAIAALKEAGKLDQVKVGGFDGSPDAVAAIKAGEMQYTVLQPVAVFSEEAVKQADNVIKTGKTGAATEKQLFDSAYHQGQCRQIYRSVRSERVIWTGSALCGRSPSACRGLPVSLAFSLLPDTRYPSSFLEAWQDYNVNKKVDVKDLLSEELPSDSRHARQLVRRQMIAETVIAEGSIRIEDLTERFGVSLMTAHRDVDELVSVDFFVRRAALFPPRQPASSNPPMSTARPGRPRKKKQSPGRQCNS